MKGLLVTGWVLSPLIILCLMSTPLISAAENDAGALFEKRCSLCRLTSRPLGATKSLKEWRQSVARMTAYAGGRISDEEAEVITNYLVEVRGK